MLQLLRMESQWKCKKRVKRREKKKSKKGKKKKDPNDIAEEWGLNGEVLSSRLKSFIGVN